MVNTGHDSIQEKATLPLVVPMTIGAITLKRYLAGVSTHSKNKLVMLMARLAMWCSEVPRKTEMLTLPNDNVR